MSRSAGGRRASALAAFGSGVAVAVQGRVNGELGTVTGSGVLAATVSFTVGLLLLILLVFGRDASRAGLRVLVAEVRSGRLPWWVLTGGFAGATYVVGQSVTVPLVGVALFTVATVAGQTGLGLAVDHWGLGPGGRMPLTGLRILAAVVATVAVWVGAGGRMEAGGAGVTGAVLLALFAGAVVAFQAAFNGRVSVAAGQPLVAGLVNFVVGLAALLVVLGLRALVSGESGSLAPLADRPWLLVGGAIGVLFVVVSAWTIRALGVLLFSLLAIAGTLVGAVVIDILLPTEGTDVTGRLVLGLLLTALSVGLAVLRRS